MRCFGVIELEESWGLRQPPETDDQKKAKVLLQMELDKLAKQAKEDAKKETEKPLSEEEIEEMEAEKKKTEDKIAELKKTAKPKPKQMFLVKEASIRDLLEAITRMGDYDRLMADLEIVKECEFD